MPNTTIIKRVKYAVADAKRALTRVRKAAVYGGGVLAQVLALGVLHGAALHYAQGGLALLTGFGIYRVPNAVKRPAWL